MRKKINKTMKELREFCRENGYIAASYKLAKDGMAWVKDNEEATYDEDTFPDDMAIVCSLEGSGVDYKDCETSDSKYVFRLHNNYNLPDVMPRFCQRVKS